MICENLALGLLIPYGAVIEPHDLVMTPKKLHGHPHSVYQPLQPWKNVPPS